MSQSWMYYAVKFAILQIISNLSRFILTPTFYNIAADMMINKNQSISRHFAHADIMAHFVIRCDIEKEFHYCLIGNLVFLQAGKIKKIKLKVCKNMRKKI